MHGSSGRVRDKLTFVCTLRPFFSPLDALTVTADKFFQDEEVVLSVNETTSRIFLMCVSEGPAASLIPLVLLHLQKLTSPNSVCLDFSVRSWGMEQDENMSGKSHRNSLILCFFLNHQ